MQFAIRSTLILAAAALACAGPAEEVADSAATASAPAAAVNPDAPNLTADLARDIEQVEKKFVDLANAIPANKYDWRPGQGVRSVGEVLKHVAADNWLFPAILGVPADSATGITEDYNTAMAYEQRKLAKDSIVAEIQKSFAHVKKSLGDTQAAQLGENVSMFGQTFSRQQAWIMATTHVHEHLGQLIAYARTNGVKPPWSN